MRRARVLTFCAFWFGLTTQATTTQTTTLPPLPSFPPAGSARSIASGPYTPSFPLPSSLFSPSSAGGTSSLSRGYPARPPPLSPFIDAHGMQSPFAAGLGSLGFAGSGFALGSAGGVAGMNVSDIRTPSPGTSVGGGDGGYFWGSRN